MSSPDADATKRKRGRPAGMTHAKQAVLATWRANMARANAARMLKKKQREERGEVEETDEEEEIVYREKSKREVKAPEFFVAVGLVGVRHTGKGQTEKRGRGRPSKGEVESDDEWKAYRKKKKVVKHESSAKNTAKAGRGRPKGPTKIAYDDSSIPPKKRGRPSNNSLQVTPKKRGRPAKTATSGRGRGRPKKVVSEAESSEDEAPLSPSSTPKGRVMTVVHVNSLQKAGRGRPKGSTKKTKPASPKKSTEQEDEANQSSDSDVEEISEDEDENVAPKADDDMTD